VISIQNTKGQNVEIMEDKADGVLTAGLCKVEQKLELCRVILNYIQYTYLVSCFIHKIKKVFPDKPITPTALLTRYGNVTIYLTFRWIVSVTN